MSWPSLSPLGCSRGRSSRRLTRPRGRVGLASLRRGGRRARPYPSRWAPEVAATRRDACFPAVPGAGTQTPFAVEMDEEEPPTATVGPLSLLGAKQKHAAVVSDRTAEIKESQPGRCSKPLAMASTQKGDERAIARASCAGFVLPEAACCGPLRSGSDGTRTRDLRRDRAVLVNANCLQTRWWTIVRVTFSSRF